MDDDNLKLDNDEGGTTKPGAILPRISVPNRSSFNLLPRGRAASPKDNTPITVNGEVINRDDIKPIVSPLKLQTPPDIAKIPPIESPLKSPVTSPVNPPVNKVESSINPPVNKVESPIKKVESSEEIEPVKRIGFVPPEIKPQVSSSKKIENIEDDETLDSDLVTPTDEMTLVTMTEDTNELLGIVETDDLLATEDLPKEPEPEKPEQKPLESNTFEDNINEVISENIEEIPKNEPVSKFTYMSETEKGKQRAIYSARYELLRSSWGYDVPPIREDQPLELIAETYEQYIKDIKIRNGIDTYKVYLVIFWLGIEYLATQKLKIDASGYTIKQMESMNKYERMLIELGEKNYRDTGVVEMTSSWPIEAQIIFTSLANMLVLIVIKWLSNYMPSNMADIIANSLSTLLAGTPPQYGQKLLGDTILNSNPTVSSDPPDVPGKSTEGQNLGAMLGSLGSIFLNGHRPGKESESKPTHNFQPAYNE